MPNLNELIEVGRDAMDAFERGIEGDDFAHALICRRGGEELYAALSAMGKERVLGAISMVPGLGQQLAERRTEMEIWLDAFIRYGLEPADSPETAAGAEVA